MMNRNMLLLFLLFILTMAVLATPVAAAVGLTITDGAKITSTDGITSPKMTIAGDNVTAGGTITIDVSSLNGYVAGYLLANSNVQVSTDSIAATWSGDVSADGYTLTLTSAGGDTIIGENVTVTFTGAAGGNAAWVADSLGDQSIPLTVTRNDNVYDPATINFMIDTFVLSITEGAVITSPHGSTSTVITVAGSDIPEGGIVVIDLWFAKSIFASESFTDANIAISSNSGIWTAAPIDNDYLYLTATGGIAPVGDTITVTFTGTSGNPWGTYTVSTGQPARYDLYAYRDGYMYPFGITINMVAPVSTGLSIENGEDITSTTGSTSPVITITDQLIARDGTITIFVPFFPSLVASSDFRNDNVLVSNTGEAVWTRDVSGNRVILTSTGNDTPIGEKVNVTFTGASNPWVTSLQGAEFSYITAVRGDEHGTGYFDIAISTPPPVDLIIAEGATITAMTGATSPVITITGADIIPGGTITMEVTGLNEYVDNGPLTNENIRINDTADQATWTANVASDGFGYYYLTLTSTGGPTIAGETVNVTFTGETNPWKGDTDGEQTVTLNAIRGDGAGSGSFNFVINTTPPPYFTLETGFSGTPREGIPPLSVSFTDMSTGHPKEWLWDFGDGTTSTDKRPRHIYSEPGKYDVSMTVWNEYDMEMVTKSEYINVINGAVVETDTQFSGLTVTNCGGPQTIMVNTSILTAALSAGNSVLEIQAPPESGFKNITFYSPNGGFSQNGDIITGNPTGVHLVSNEIAPASGFSDTIGKMSSFMYTIDLPSYPCNAKLSTEIWEGAVPEYDSLFRKVASENHAYPVGTAYTVKITKDNFPSDAQIKMIMSVDSGWSESISGEYVFIWHIADDKSFGEILPTRYLYTDPVTNLDYYEADSPRGFSTFGISSLTGPNNPFQIIAFIGSNIISQGINSQNGQGSGSGTSVSANAEPGSPNSEMQGGGIVVPTPVAPSKPAPLSQPAMSTNVGMVGWLLAIIQDYPIILVGVVGVIAVAAYFGWWKRRL